MSSEVCGRDRREENRVRLLSGVAAGVMAATLRRRIGTRSEVGTSSPRRAEASTMTDGTGSGGDTGEACSTALGITPPSTSLLVHAVCRSSVRCNPPRSLTARVLSRPTVSPLFNNPGSCRAGASQTCAGRSGQTSSANRQPARLEVDATRAWGDAGWTRGSPDSIEGMGLGLRHEPRRVAHH